MIFLIEAVIGCIFFTVGVAAAMKNPLAGIHDYPPKIIQRVKELGLITEEQTPKSKKVLLKKLIFCLVIVVLLAVVLVYVNRADSFLQGFLISYGLWLVIDWYDALVLDCLWFCHSKKFIIPGTEDMTSKYHNYLFHILGSAKGMLIGLPVALMAGGIVALIAIL